MKKFTVVYELSFRDKPTTHIMTFESEKNAIIFAVEQNSMGNKADLYVGLGKHKKLLKSSESFRGEFK